MSLAVRFVASHAGVPAELWRAWPKEAVEGEWWYRALETSGLDDQFTFLYAVLEEDGKPAGLAPSFLMDLPLEIVLPDELLPIFRLGGRLFKGLLRQRTLFVGSPCSDEGMVLLMPGLDRAAALAALQEAFFRRAAAERASLLVWKDLGAGLAAELALLAPSAGLFPMVSYPGTRVALPPGGKEAYLAALKPGRRQNLRRKLRRGQEAARLRAETLTHPGPAVLDEMFALFWQTYEKGKTKFERLNRKLFDRFAEQDGCRWILLREEEGDRAVAFMLCFVEGSRFINKFVGFDYARPADWMLYFRLWDAALDLAYGLGADSIQSGQTGYGVKIELGHALEPLTNFCRHRNRLVHQIFALVGRGMEWGDLDEDLKRVIPTAS